MNAAETRHILLSKVNQKDKVSNIREIADEPLCSQTVLSSRTICPRNWGRFALLPEVETILVDYSNGNFIEIKGFFPQAEGGEKKPDGSLPGAKGAGRNSGFAAAAWRNITVPANRCRLSACGTVIGAVKPNRF